MQGSFLPAKARKKALFFVKTSKSALDKLDFYSMVSTILHECTEYIVILQSMPLMHTIGAVRHSVPSSHSLRHETA